jgi:hypothetical protein
MRANALCSSSWLICVIGSNGSTGTMALATNGASIVQNSVRISHSVSAASAEVAGDRNSVEQASATASHTPA